MLCQVILGQVISVYVRLGSWFRLVNVSSCLSMLGHVGSC
jgi:hypothetical protein